MASTWKRFALANPNLQEKSSFSRDIVDYVSGEIHKVSITYMESKSSYVLLPEQISYKNMVTREFSGNLDPNEVEEFEMQEFEENTQDIRVEENSIRGYRCPEFLPSTLEER